MSKIGIQYLGPYPRARHLIDQMIDAGMNIKGVVSPSLKPGQDMGLMLDIAKRSPGHVHVARIFEYDQEVSEACKTGADPIYTAQAWAHKIALLVSVDPALKTIWYETGPNEPGEEFITRSFRADGRSWLDLYYEEAIRQTAKHGIRIIWGNFSVGTPDYGDLVFLNGALTATRQANLAVPYRVGAGMHEYGVMYQGHPYSMGSAGNDAFILRYYDQRAAKFLSDIPKFITELGDDPEVRGDRVEYIRRFAMYDAAIHGDPMVVAAYPYVLTNPQEEWIHFTLDGGEADDLIVLARNSGGNWKPPLSKPQPIPAPLPAPAPAPSPSPAPSHGQARSIDVGVRMRRGPGTGYTVLERRLKRGEVVTLVDNQGGANIPDENRHNWVYIRTSDGIEGWTAAWLLAEV